jgi:hypothetical protein
MIKPQKDSDASAPTTSKKVFVETYGWPLELLSTDFGRVFRENKYIIYG